MRYAQSIFGIDGSGWIAGSGGSGFVSSAQKVAGSSTSGNSGDPNWDNALKYYPNNFVDDAKEYYDENGTLEGLEFPGTSSTLPTDSTNSSESISRTNLMDQLTTYLEGFFTNQGKENQLNRDYNSQEAALNRQFQADEAAKQRLWYEQMSNSAYQRTVADLKAAGLNPALAYSNGGASTASTGVASGSAASYNQTGGDTISSLLTGVANVISAVTGASSSKFSNSLKLLKLLSMF